MAIAARGVGTSNILGCVDTRRNPLSTICVSPNAPGSATVSSRNARHGAWCAASLRCALTSTLMSNRFTCGPSRPGSQPSHRDRCQAAFPPSEGWDLWRGLLCGSGPCDQLAPYGFLDESRHRLARCRCGCLAYTKKFIIHADRCSNTSKHVKGASKCQQNAIGSAVDASECEAHEDNGRDPNGSDHAERCEESNDQRIEREDRSSSMYEIDDRLSISVDRIGGRPLLR
jgi:hypothetical protein